MSPRRSTAGFTFIEIAVALIIVAIGSVLAIPMIEGGFDSREVRRAAREIASTFIHVRGEAVAKGEAQAVVIDPRDNGVYTTDWGKWAVLTDRAQIEKLEGGEAMGDGAMRVVFFPNGSSTGADVVIGSRRDRARAKLWVHLDPLIGSVRVQDEP